MFPAEVPPGDSCPLVWALTAETGTLYAVYLVFSFSFALFVVIPLFKMPKCSAEVPSSGSSPRKPVRGASWTKHGC